MYDVTKMYVHVRFLLFYIFGWKYYHFCPASDSFQRASSLTHLVMLEHCLHEGAWVSGSHRGKFTDVHTPERWRSALLLGFRVYYDLNILPDMHDRSKSDRPNPTDMKRLIDWWKAGRMEAAMNEWMNEWMNECNIRPTWPWVEPIYMWDFLPNLLFIFCTSLPCICCLHKALKKALRRSILTNWRYVWNPGVWCL